MIRVAKAIALLMAGVPLGAGSLPPPPPMPHDIRASYTRLGPGLPLPPPLPANPPTDYAAPVPNANLQTPPSDGLHGTEFAVRIYPMRQFDTSDAFPPGSAYEAPEERKPLQPPGFMVTVPLR